MLRANKVVSKSGGHPTSLGWKFSTAADNLQAAKVLGDISKLVNELITHLDKGDIIKVKSGMALVKKALPIVENSVTDNMAKICPKDSSSVKYTVSQVNKDNKVCKLSEEPHKKSKRRKSNSFLAVQDYVKTSKSSIEYDSGAETLAKLSDQLTKDENDIGGPLT
jgi:hypothetical protein